MKVLHLSTTESSGGAGMAANRLHKGLQKCGVQSRMLVQYKKSDDWSIFGPRSRPVKYLYQFRAICNSLPLYRYPHRSQTPFSPAITTNVDFDRIQEFNPDIIHLHWVNTGYLAANKLKNFSRPILWTFHDMWPMTGGCHYDDDCRKYESSCGSCPQLGSNRIKDMSGRLLASKLKHWQSLDIHVVTPSNWLAGCAKKSTLFRNRDVHVIPNGLDLEIYKSVNRESARQLWSLSPEKKYILFGAVNSTSSPRKGFDLLNQAMKSLSANFDDEKIELIIFGATEPENPDNFGYRANYLGEVHGDVSLVSLYSAVDLFVAPSRQDNLPNTVIEAMSCSVPVVAFDIGGMPDMIEHMVNGYLAKPFNPQDLADGMNWVLEDRQRYKQLSVSARYKVENLFGMQKSVEQYSKLYRELINRVND